MALKLNLNRDKIVGQDSEKKESTLIQPRIKLSMAEPAAVETTKPKSYGPTISERENSVIGQLATDSKMAYRAESRNDNSLWKQTEKDRVELDKYTEKLMKDLNDQLTKYRADNDTDKIVETQKRLTELQKQTDTHWTDRVGNTVGGALKQSAGAYGSAFAVTTEDMLDGGRVNVRGESMDKLSFDKNKALQYTQGVRDKTMALTQSGAADIEQAKKGLGTVGRLAVDTAAGLTQLGTDILIGGATHVGAMPVLAVRAFGGAADQAKMDGASVDQQIAYGLASATVELATEKLFSANIISSKAFGKGAADDLLTGIVAGLEDVASTPNGRAMMNRVGTMLTSGLSEGLEEGIAAVVEPISAKLAYGKDMDWDAKEIGYQVLIGALTGAVTGISGQNTNEYRAKVAGQQIGQSIKDSGNLSGIVRQALHTDKESAAYKKADEIRSRKTPATNQEITELARLTFAQVAKEQAEQTAAVEQAQSADLGQPVSTKTATVLDTGTSAYVALGMKTKRAEAKAKVVQKLINGEEVSLDGMKSLNLTDAKYREIFTQLTGVVFPEGMTNQDQLINIAKTANTVSRVEQVDPGTPVNVQTEVQEPIAQDIAQPVAQVSDDAQPLSYEQFGEAYRRTEGADLSIDEPTMRSVYDSYLEHENQTVMESGVPVTRTQFRSNLRKTEAGAKMSDREIDRYFDSYRESQTEAPKDLRHKLSKDVQDVIAAFEKKLGIRIEVTESIRSEKTGQTAEGVSDTGIIRLALDARGELSYDEAVMQVLRHEVTHQLKRAVSEDTYNAFAKYVREFDAEFYKTQYETVSKTYAEQFKGSDEAKKQAAIDDEVIARCAEKLFEDEAFIRMVVGKNRTLAEKIHDIFEKLLKKLNLTGEAKKQLQAKRDLWAAMLNEAEENTKKGIKQGTEATVVDGKQYSYKSMSHDIREGTMYADLVKPQTLAMLDMKKSDIDKLFRQLNSLLKYMEPNLKILDYNEEYTKDDRPYHPYKQNSDPLYKISLDFSTMCTKRLLMQHIIERLQVMEQKPMSAAHQMAIREKIKQYAEIEKGLQVACAMCYVESARLHSPEQVQHYLDDPGKIVAKHFSFKNKEFNAAVKEMQTEIKRKHGFNPNASKGQLSKAAKEEFRTRTDEMRENYKPTPEEQAIVDTANGLPVETYLTAENLTVLSKEHPEIYDAFTTYIRNATRSKSTQTPVPYYYGDSKSGDVTVSDKFIESMNDENGMRFSSWSDYMFKHVLDMMTAVIELSVRGSPMHGYTKFPQFVRVFGKTGMMFNLSGVADGMGLDENGKLLFSDSESVDITEARKVRNLYPETAGVQCIGVSDDHIRKLMATDWIDYIIPYHVSGMSAALRRLAGIAGWSDYSDVQHAKPDPNAAKHGKEPVFSEFFVTENPGDGLDCMRKSAEKYKQLCAERGLIPKFNDFADDPNYWKLLIDRKMINQRTGALIFQKPVKPIFNFREIRKQVRQEVANYDPQREQRVFDYIVEHMDAVDVIAENVQAEMKAGAKGLKTKVEDLGNEMTATAVNGDGQYSFADEYEGTNPELAYLPWENQVDLALSGKYNDLIRSDGYTENGKRLNSVLYVTKEPTTLLQEAGLSDLPLIMTQQHLRSIVSQRWDSENPDRVVNWHNHEIDPELVKKVPEFIRKPVAIFKSEGKQVGGLVILTSEFDSHGNPICVFINPDQPSFTYDGAVGPAHFVNMYGLEKFDQFLQRAVNNDGIIYQDKKMGQHPAVRDTQTKGVSSGEGLTSAYNTIVREKDPTVKPGERQYSLTDEADSTGTHFLSKGQLEYFKDSKVRDENGKLIPVYHGTQRAGFTEFSETDDYGYFFTSSLTLANTYSGGGDEFAPRRVDTWDDAIAAARDLGFVLERDSDGSYVLSNDWHRSTWNEDELRDLEAELYEADSAGRGVYATYLNLKDPLIIEGGGASWDSITGSEFQDSIEAVAQDGELELVIRDRVTGEERLRRNFTDFEDVREALIDLYGGEEDAITDIMDRLQAEIDEEMQFGNYDDDTIDIDYGGYWGYGRSTRDWVREAMEEGYDGVIFKNIVDAGKYGYGSESGDVYVALNANQIKSVNNLNPTEDPDLRYSFADEVANALGVQYNTTDKYWRPNFNQAEWNLWNYRVRKEAGTTDQYIIDDSTKWLYANEKGVQVFGLYSTNNPEDPTLLYALSGKKAGKTYQRLKEWEALKRGRHQSNEVLGAPIRPSESIEGGRSDTTIDFPADDRGLATTEDVRVSGEHTGSNQSTDSAEGQTSHGDGSQLSLADDLTPEKRKAFIETFDAEFGEGAAEQMFKAHDQMARAAARAEKRAERAAESKTAAETLAKEKSERDLTAFLMYHNRKLREQQRKYADDKAKLQKAKAEAVKEAVETTKLVERAKADIRVQATEMHLGKKAAEQKRTLKERMVDLKAEAADRLRVTKDTYRGKMKEMSKLQRNAAKHLLSDKKAAEKRKNEIQTAQGPVDTIRKNPRERVKVEKMKALAQELRTRGRTAYRYFVNQAQEIDNFAKRQKGGIYASTLVNVLGGSSSTVESIFKNGLVDRSGNRIGESLKDVLLCMDATGKKVDEAKQALLQDYILHLHNIDRMSFVAKAKARLDAFEGNPENAWLVGLDGKDLAMLVAATDKETADAIFDKYGKVKKGKSGWTEADRQLAWEYASLLHNYREAQDKPVFADENGKPVTADTSREIVAKYEKDNAWLIDKANGIFEWWDLFMRNWAVGDSLSLAEYETMHETYPHYAPTYRVDKAGPGGAVSVSGAAATVGKATKAAKGSTLEIVPIEDSFANIASKIVRLARVNELYMNIIDTAMLDEEGLFSDMAVFDWDWQTGEYEQALQLQAILNGETEAEIEESAKAGLDKDGANYKLTGWSHGRKYSAWISEDLYKSIADTTGATDEQLKKLTKLGNTLTGPMKTAITGINPFFAIRNLSRDIPSAIINSTGGKFPKYWAQAIAEMKSNSENWQAFKALGGTNAGYYNNEKGFVDAMAKGPGVVKTATEGLGWINNVTEAATRFAEYLSTIDRMGDTYEARLQGIKNSAEVTVDFSRKGSYGKFINAWVPYWNPAVQGIDKMIRSVVESPDGSAIWKQATKTLGRAATQTILFEAILQAVLHALDRDDEWEKLSDRDKAAYYCIPIPLWDEHKFLKIAKNREWGAILGTPFMLMLEGLDGRQNPFENYVETALEPNFLPGAILRPREGGGFTSDVIGVSQALDLAYNEDFAGRTIIPYALQQGSKTEQYDSETSRLSVALGKLINFSPMQIDYIVKDYFGDFGELFTGLTAPGTYDVAPEQALKNAWDIFTGSFHTDNRYSNQTVSTYYETLDELGKVVNDKKNQMGTEAHKQTKEYKTQKGLQEMYGNRITELNKEVRGLPDGPDKDTLKEEIAQLADLAMDFYKQAMSGEIKEPLLTVTYANLPESVSNELIRLDSFAKDYAFEPTNNTTSKYTDPEDKQREYILDDESKEKRSEIYSRTYGEVMGEIMNKSEYRKANDQKKVEMLEEARDSVAKLTKDEFLDWLAANRRSTLKK